MNILTYNCKNITSSKHCIEELMKEADIILLQEHWLFNFEMRKLNINPSFKTIGKAVDEENLIEPKERPRGYGGVAILWHERLHPRIKTILDGNSRVQALLLTLSESRIILIVCCYMPTRGPRNSDCEYDDTIAQINHIIKKYKHTNLIIGGDFNNDITTSVKSRRKLNLLNFLKENQLQLPSDSPIGPTFTHSNGSDCSCIDYIFINTSASSEVLNLKKNGHAGNQPIRPLSLDAKLPLFLAKQCN